MLIGKKIRLKPTPEQEILLRKSLGCARFAFDFCLETVKKSYDDYIERGKKGEKPMKPLSVNSLFTEMKKTTHPWLCEVGCNVVKKACADVDDAYKRFFSGESGYPKKKKKHDFTNKFYVNYERFRRVNGGCHCEKIGFIRTAEPLPKIQKGQHYSNPRISFDGKFWYISFGYEIEVKPEEHTGESLGIDLGIKDLAICSNGKTYKNVNKIKRMKKLKRKKRREQRKLSRKIEANIKEYWTDTKGHKHPIYKRKFSECKNFQKQKKKTAFIDRKLANTRLDYTHKTTSEIVKTKPSRVVMEDLNVKGMMKNKHLSKAIQEQTFGEFIRQMRYKCALHGIEFVQVPRFYPSSKTCSCCGFVKKSLKLSERVFRCESCGLEIDRDFNASLNLAHYQSA